MLVDFDTLLEEGEIFREGENYRDAITGTVVCGGCGGEEWEVVTRRWSDEIGAYGTMQCEGCGRVAEYGD